MPNIEIDDTPDRDEEQKYDVVEGLQIYTSHTYSALDDTDPFKGSVDTMKALSGVSPNKKRSLTAMQKKFEGHGDTSSKKIEEHIDTITGYNAFEVVLPPYNLDALAKLYETSSPHYAAVNAKVSNIVGLGYDFVESPLTKSKLEDRSDDEEQLNKYRKKLMKAKNVMFEYMDGMNSEDTIQEILTKVWKDYEATGNGYIEVGRSSSTGKIEYIGHVPSKTLRIRRARDGFVQIITNKAVFFRNFGDTKTKDPIGGDRNPNEIIHIKKYAPSSTFYGVPDIVAATQAIAGNDFAAKFNLEYFENKAVPRHVIILKGATLHPKLAKNLLEFFETGLKGKNHRSMYVPLPGDKKDEKVEFSIEPVDTKIQDASFEKYKKSNLSEILMAHRVPLTKVGMAEGVALAVARDADKTFKEAVCQPEQRVFEKKINKIVKELTDIFLFKLKEMSLTDENTQSQIDERRRKTGTETANEQRAARGLPGIEGGDELFDMNAAGKAAQLSAESRANRERDSQRSAGATDSAGEGRNPKGEGRSTP